MIFRPLPIADGCTTPLGVVTGGTGSPDYSVNWYNYDPKDPDWMWLDVGGTTIRPLGGLSLEHAAKVVHLYVGGIE